MRYLLCTALLLGGLAACDDAPAEDGPDRGLVDGDSGPRGDGGLLDAARADTGDPQPGEVGPAVNSIIPSRGPLEGGTRIRIVGSGFTEGAIVQIGSMACRDVEVVGEFRVECVTPRGDVPGSVRVTVRGGDGERPAVVEEGFTYFRPVELLGVEPNRGPARGGVDVELDGRGFVEPTLVSFGDLQATEVEIRNANRIRARVPAGVAGPVDVVVRNVNGTARLEDGYTYYEDLLVADIAPRWGFSEGGEEVLLSGTGLLEASEVSFGGGRARVVASELDRARLRVETPAHEPGAVGVSVSNSNGEWSRDGAFLFVDRDGAGFGIDGVVPGRVASVGGQTFLVGGRGFTAQTRVTVDGVLVPCELENPGLLSCLSPPHEPGRVDVAVEDGEQRDVRADGLTFFEDIEVYDVRPARGAVAGGTVVELLGQGFSVDMQLTLGGSPMELLEVEDTGERAYARTPPGHPGWVALQVESPDDVERLADAFEYFQPISRFGGIWGDAIGSANVTVLNACDGEPVVGAVVVAVELASGARHEGLTDEAGQATLSEIEFEPPVSISAFKTAFEATTYEHTTAENSTIYLYPQAGCGGGGGGDGENPRNALLSGAVYGIDQIEKPRGDGQVLAAFVEISHTSQFNRWSQIYPDHRGILFEDGPFEIDVRPGERAVVVTAGWVDGELLRRYLDGERDLYQLMRSGITPKRMGVQRFVSAGPGRIIDGLEIELDKSLDLNVPVTLENPSGGVPGAPTLFTAEPFLDFGPEGYWALDSAVEGPTHLLESRYLPDLEEWDDDIEVAWVAHALQDDDLGSGLPYTRTFDRSRSLSEQEGVLIGPFVGTVAFVEPGDDGVLGPGARIEWRTHAGVDGPTEPADLHLVLVETAGVPIWTYFIPGAVDGFRFPPVPDEVEAGLENGTHNLLIVSMITYGEFDWDDWTFDDVSLDNRQSYSVNQLVFLP